MRMRKLFVGLLVLGLAVGMLGMVAFAKKGDDDDPSDTVTDAVTWMVRGFIELAIDDSSYDFVTIDAGVDTVSDDEANTLFVRSNADWELSSSYSVGGSGSEHLEVSLGAEEGQGDATINVGYTLFNLRSMEPGDYSVTVTYTVTAE